MDWKHLMKRPLLGYWFGFGTWRLGLAVLVALSHLWAGMIGGPAAYSVWGFFVLSGYLMTYVLTRKYGFDAGGLRAYAFNRFIRIMPSYYVAVVVGVITIVALKNCVDLTRLNPQFTMPHGWDWFNPLTLLPIFRAGALPVPVSGALATEVGMYILMPFMARSRSAAWMALIMSVIANISIGFDVSTFPARYTYSATTMVAFAAGSLTCHYIDYLRRIAVPSIALIAWGLHSVIWLKYDPWPWTYGLYSSVILSVWVVVSLDSRETSQLDKTLGDWSYPMYLFHTTVGAWLLPYFGYGRSFKFFLLSFVLTIGVCWILVKFFDRPLSKLKISRKPQPKPFEEAAAS
jgi:peptidoglycan/LPS O-acetylase OafA/YrhL